MNTGAAQVIQKPLGLRNPADGDGALRELLPLDLEPSGNLPHSLAECRELRLWKPFLDNDHIRTLQSD